MALFPGVAATLRWSAYRALRPSPKSRGTRSKGSEFEYTASVLLGSTAQFRDSGHSIELPYRVAFPSLEVTCWRRETARNLRSSCMGSACSHDNFAHRGSCLCGTQDPGADQ